MFGAGEAELQLQEEIEGGALGVGAAMKVTDAVKPFDGQGQAGQQPDRQQARQLPRWRLERVKRRASTLGRFTTK